MLPAGRSGRCAPPDSRGRVTPPRSSGPFVCGIVFCRQPGHPMDLWSSGRLAVVAGVQPRPAASASWSRGGQAGLAAGYHLRRLGLEFVIRRS